MKLLILAALAASSLLAQPTVAAKAGQGTVTPTGQPKAELKLGPDGSTKITLPLGEIAVAYGSLLKLADLDIPRDVSVKIQKTRRSVEPEWKLFLEQREALSKKYGKSAEGIPSENQSAYMNELGALFNVKTEITIFPVPLSVVPKEAKLSANDLDRIEPFLEKENK